MRAAKMSRVQTNSTSKGQHCDLNSPKGCELLIDTGTYLTYIPRKMFETIFKNYSISSFENCSNYENDKLPDI